MAGATGLEPATFGVTGRGFINKINGPSDSAPDISGPKTAIPTPELESFPRLKTAALLALMALSLAAFIVAAWVASVPCRPGERTLYIVPPFPMDIFAIRTKRSYPHRYDNTHPNNHNQPAQILAAGEGRYVDPTPNRRSYEGEERRGDKNVPVRLYYASGYEDADFPFKLARSEIREATDKALGLKIFDQLGVLPQTRNPDPVVCGQILFPDRPHYRGAPRSAVNFFVAWWLDTKTL
jgi:hypothetical protein